MAAEAGLAEDGEWVLLLYRLPRQPSTPRSAVWRRLKRLGVAQLADGVVALPADARTREQLEWVADEVRAAAGTAVVWLARPTSVGQERELAGALSAARAQEYLSVREQAQALGDAASPQERVRTARRLREELRHIRHRDFFPPAERAVAFDMPGVELSHHGADCTFETLLRRYDLTDPVLWRLAALVHEADLDDGRFDAPEAPGFDLALRALSMVEPDERVLELTRPLFDGPYEFFHRELLLGRAPA